MGRDLERGYERKNARKTENSCRCRQVRRIVCIERNISRRNERQHRFGGGMGYLPQFHAGWAMRFVVQNPAHQPLHLRLCLLQQPPEQRRETHRFHRRRAG